MLSSEVADLLEDNSIGTVAEDIFIGSLPTQKDDGTSADNGVYLINSIGEQHKYLDTNYDSIEFWSANINTESAFNKLKDIKDLLSRKANFETTNYYIYFIHDVSGIMDMDRTVDGLKMYKLTLRFIYRDKNLIS